MATAALILVTAVWGITFVQVKDAVELYPFLAFLAAQPGRSLVAGALSAGAYAISVWAMTRAPVALVAALRETSVLFAALLGSRVLRERLSGQRWAGIAAVIAGVVALKIA